MTITLTENVAPGQSLVDVDNPDEPRLDEIFKLDDEVVIVRGVGGALILGRGILGSERAAHEAGTELVPFDVSADGGGVSPTWEFATASDLIVTGGLDLYADDVEVDDGLGQLLLGAKTYASLSVGSNQITLDVDDFRIEATDKINLRIGSYGFNVTIGSGAPSGGSTNDVYVDVAGGEIWFKGGGTWRRVVVDQPTYWGNLPQEDPGSFGVLWVDPAAGYAIKVSQG